MNRMKFYPKSKFQCFRLATLILIATALFTYLFVFPLAGFISYQPQNGDIIFQSLQKNELVETIEGATNSPYSHCGVVRFKDGVTHALVKVKHTPLYLWLVQGRFGSFSVYRLKSEYQQTISRFIEELDKFVGLPYDFHYDMGDDAIYCSELVYKAYKQATGMEMGKLVRLGDLKWQPFADIIRKYEGGAPPLQRVMITLRDLAEANQLVKVYEYGF